MVMARKTGSAEEERQLKQFLELPLFQENQGVARGVQHHIRLKTSEPIKQRYRPQNPKMQASINFGAPETGTIPIEKKTDDPTGESGGQMVPGHSQISAKLWEGARWFPMSTAKPKTRGAGDGTHQSHLGLGLEG
ncbi:hypothetical protein JTB14_026656 [Gonioctena quinquepunctata]|nr:hypothetical protein JTB14_026656 [Gonioctena quinquepunctata]